MAQPVSPVIEGQAEIWIARHQPPYKPMAAVVIGDRQGTLLTKWKFTFWERLWILFTGSFYLWVMTFGDDLQPLAITTRIYKKEPVSLKRCFQRFLFRASNCWQYSALEKECLSCDNWSPLAELWAKKHWDEGE